MKRHEITLEGLQNWLVETETLYAQSTAENKKLTVTMNGGIRVYHNNQVIWQGIQPFTAVEKYNEI